MHAHAAASNVHASLRELMTTLDRCCNPTLRDALRDHIHSPLRTLCDAMKTQSDIGDQVGRLWIGYAKLVLYVFVPDAPIDPAALDDRSSRFWQAEQSVLQKQVSLHRGQIGRAHV